MPWDEAPVQLLLEFMHECTFCWPEINLQQPHADSKNALLICLMLIYEIRSADASIFYFILKPNNSPMHREI
jgi:hypothetical protein